MRILILTLSVLVLSVSCTGDTTAPRVLKTTPSNGDYYVDPALNEISVTFSEEMQDGNWSWAYTTEESFPALNGKPRFEEGFTTNILPVQLESNREYEIWINSDRFKSFKDVAGNPSTPYKLTFRTR